MENYQPLPQYNQYDEWRIYEDQYIRTLRIFLKRPSRTLGIKGKVREILVDQPYCLCFTLSGKACKGKRFWSFPYSNKNFDTIRQVITKAENDQPVGIKMLPSNVGFELNGDLYVFGLIDL